MVCNVLLLAASLSFAQAGTEGLDHFGGLNDTDSPATIGNQCQDCLNVEANRTGTALLKARGFSREASLTVTTGPVTGAHHFVNSSGNTIDIVCHDRYCSASVNGAAFSPFISTLSAGITRYSIVSADGYAYGANDKRDPVWRFDGTNDDHPTEIPAGSLLAIAPDRLIVANTAANPNSVNYSKSGDFIEFTVGVNEVDPYTDNIGAPGRGINGLILDGQRLFAFKDKSITTCLMGHQYTTECDPVSSSIGTNDPGAIVAAPGGIYFRGQDRGFWRLSGDGLEPISRQISVLVSSQAAGTVRQNTQSTQADWQAGVFSPTNSFDATSTVGSVFASSTTMLDTSSVNFAGGTLVRVSVGDINGSVTLASDTFRDDFSDGNMTIGPTWTPLAGKNWGVSSGRLQSSDDDAAISADSINSTGSWVFTLRGNVSSDSYVKFISNGNNLTTSEGFYFRETYDASGNTMTWQLVKTPAGTVLSQATPPSQLNTDHTITVLRNSSLIEVVSSTGGVILRASDPDYQVSTKVMLYCNIRTDCQYDNFYFYVYKTSGVYFSGEFDTAFTSPIGGPFAASSSTPNGTTLAYQVRSRNAQTDAFTAWTTVVGGTGRILENRRFQQYLSSFTTVIGTVTPRIDEIANSFVSTGTITQQCIPVGSGISAWGILSCAETLAGAGSFSYSAATATHCQYISTSAFYAQGNNSLIASANLGAALQIRALSLLGSATDQAQLDACSVYWNDGTPAPPVWGAYDSRNNAIYWSVNTSTSGTNNRVLKYDIALSEWFPLSLSAGPLLYKDLQLWFGSSDGGYWNRYGHVDTFNGAAINAYWKSRDFTGQAPFAAKNWQRAAIIAKNQGSGTLDISYNQSNNISGSYSLSLSTTAGVPYVRSFRDLGLASPSEFINFQFGNNAGSQPFEIIGFGLGFAVQPWKAGGP